MVITVSSAYVRLYAKSTLATLRSAVQEIQLRMRANATTDGSELKTKAESARVRVVYLCQ